MKKIEWKDYIGADGRTFAKRVKDLLAIANMNQTELASKTGISTGNMSNYLQTDSSKKVSEPTALNIIKIADALGVSCGYLLTGIKKVGQDTVSKQEVLDQMSKTLDGISDNLMAMMSGYFSTVIGEIVRLIYTKEAIQKEEEAIQKHT